MVRISDSVISIDAIIKRGEEIDKAPSKYSSFRPHPIFYFL